MNDISYLCDNFSHIRWANGLMSSYPHLDYSMKAVRKVGKSLAGTVHWEESKKDEILEIFKIANSWRDSHSFPMRSVRMSLERQRRTHKIKGFTAARQKRMPSIRKKLARLKSLKLDQINDIAGCRLVANDIDSVRRMIEVCRSKLKHEVRQEYDYINMPKPDGYRSHHMVVGFSGEGESAVFSGRRVEIQFRTRLQHSWATAVEAVGLYRQEDFKAGIGDTEWLRFFQLVSLEFAFAENCGDAEILGDREERILEIKRLSENLGAFDVLENIRNVTHYIQNFVADEYAKPSFYLIKYTRDVKSNKNTVTVEAYNNALDGSASYDKAEEELAKGVTYTKVVLVDVTTADSLAEAYPNYFGDVSLFMTNLKAICGGENAIEYTMAPQQVVAPKPSEMPDPAALHRRYTRWNEDP